MSRGFKGYHPAVNLAFYLAVIIMPVCFMHPAQNIISFFGAAAYYVRLKGKGGCKFVSGLIPVFLLASIINPLFSHRGSTLICYLPGGNPLTLESIIYGLSSGIMLVTVLLWFASFSIVVDVDKILDILGSVMPAAGTLLGMAAGFVQKYARQAKKTAAALKAVAPGEGYSVDFASTSETAAALRAVAPGAGSKNTKKKGGKSSGSKRTIFSRINEGTAVFNIVTTWALENSVMTADSMRARGYGSGRRTRYRAYRFEKRDAAVLALIVTLSAVVTYAVLSGAVGCVYYPRFVMDGRTFSEGFSGATAGPAVYAAYAAQLSLCFLPFVIDVAEDVKWRILQSKI